MATVRVRILVAVTDDGHYIAEGYGDTKPAKLIASMTQDLHHHMTPPIEFYWIEADVPIPPKLQPATITASALKRRRA